TVGDLRTRLRQLPQPAHANQSDKDNKAADTETDSDDRASADTADGSDAASDDADESDEASDDDDESDEADARSESPPAAATLDQAIDQCPSERQTDRHYDVVFPSASDEAL